jgi:hypothetical protein
VTLGYVEAVYRLEADLTPGESAVLATLGAAANSQGVLWIRRSVVAQRTRLHPDTVKSILQTLATKALIVKGPRFRDDGSQSANAIRLTFKAYELIPEKGGVTSPTRGSHAPPLSQDVTSAPGVQDPRGAGVLRPPLEPSLEQRTPKVPKGGRDA